MYQGYVPLTEFERNKSELRYRLSEKEYQRFMNGAYNDSTRSLADLVSLKLEELDWRDQHQDERP